MTFDDLDLLKEFVVESQEHLSDVEEKLLAMEGQGEAIDVAAVNTVFRAVHSIKGAAGFMGLGTLERLAHREEEVLNKLRAKEIRPTSDVINALLRATDRIKFLLDSIETSNDIDISDQLTILEEILVAHESGTSAILELSKEVVTEKVSEKKLDIQLSSEALREFLEECIENVDQLEQDLLAIEETTDDDRVLNRIFRSMHTIKGSSGFVGYSSLENLTHAAEDLLVLVRDGKLQFTQRMGHILLQCVDAVRTMIRALELNDASLATDPANIISELQSLKTADGGNIPHPQGILSKKSTASEEKASRVESLNSPSTQTETVQSSTGSASVRSGANTEGPSKGGNESNLQESSIRVDVSILDKLMTCVGELVLARNQILQHSNRTSDNGLQASAQRLNIITSELQEHVMKTRMQPIGNVWNKFPRLVRDLAVICEKQVRIEMEGKETELDKTIIEAVKDPLTHLVRNTVDHGIELPQVRVKNGKPAEGCLYLRAYHEGGLVNIEIADDGAGLNLEKIRAKAVEKGLFSADEVAQLSEREVSQIIFMPGFSTADKVSNVSGRGVGMDVVKTNIERIGGTIDLQSERGKGTTIRVKIPLTLAIIPALIVSCDNNRFAIPQVNLLELLRLEGEQASQKIEWINGTPVYRLRGRILPLIDLRSILRKPKQCVENQSDINIIVLRSEERQFGLVVDKINDTEEIVVKPLSSQLKNLQIYSGATIMGDGKVALILDVNGIAADANASSKEGTRQALEMVNLSQQGNTDSNSLLVISLGVRRKLAIPIAQVARLEKLPASHVEIAGESEVVQYRGDIMPIIRLQHIFHDCIHLEEPDLLNVVVHNQGGRNFGVVIDKIIDVVDCDPDSFPTGQSERRSAVINGAVTDLIDLPSIIAQTLVRV